MPQIVCWMKTPFLLSVMSQYLHTMETSGENPDNLLFDVVNVNFGRILPRLPRFTTSYTTLHNRVREIIWEISINKPTERHLNCSL